MQQILYYYPMINRTTVRTRVMQTLFAYYTEGDKTPLTAKKELLRSFSDSYSLYMLLLDYINEFTRYADDQIAQTRARAKATHANYQPNMRLVENTFAQQVFENRTLRNYIEQEKLSWNMGMLAVEDVYRKLQDAPFYKEYLALEETNYEEDKKLWRKIFTDLLMGNEAFYTALEELELALDTANWTIDADYIISFVVKTIKRFKEQEGADQALLPMFDNEQEVEFATRLLQTSIDHHDEYAAMIDAHLKNWDASRIALMDRILLTAALAEIINFPDIALDVSFNEYIELSKEYSSDKSYIFINGILNEIIRDLKRDNKLLKAVLLK